MRKFALVLTISCYSLVALASQKLPPHGPDCASGFGELWVPSDHSRDPIDELVEVETQIDALERETWQAGASRESTQKIADLRKRVEESLNEPEALETNVALLRKQVREFNDAPKVDFPKIEDILENPDRLRNNQRMRLGSDKSEMTLQFEESALTDLLKADRSVIKKFVDSIRMGAPNDKIDPAKIRWFASSFDGKQGRMFEVRVIHHHGHQRLFGCVKGGVFKVLVYDPHAPESGPSLNKRYNTLCR